MNKKIAIIGANDQQNPLILKAREMGFETHTFAWQTGGEIGEKTSDFFYPISAGNKDEILEMCKKIGISAIVSVGSDIAAQTSAYVAQSLGLVCNRFENVCGVSNKLNVRKILAQNGITQPKYAEIGDTIPFEELNALRFPLVVKPSDRSGGRGIALVRDPSELFAAINNAREASFERKAIVEEYIEGNLYSCECISLKCEHKIIGFTQRDVTLAGKSFCEYRHSQPAILPFSVENELKKTVPAILDCLGLCFGASSVEFIVDSDNRFYIIEVSPTMYGDYIGTHLIPLVYGFDYTGAVIDIACGKAVKLADNPAKAIASVSFEYDASNGQRGKHTVFSEPIKEFGGCLKFRPQENTAYFCENESILALNSEYTAFWCALCEISPQRVHIPYYASSVWEKIAGELGIETVYYHIDSKFLPLDIDEKDGDAVFLINYYGLCTDYIKNAPFKHKIADNSMAFFEEPMHYENTFTIYSARKFFALPDGAYLVSNVPFEKVEELETDISYKRTRMLFHALELGSGDAYKESQTNEQELVLSRKAMSGLTKKLVCAVDYKNEKRLRNRNFNILHSYLKEFNLLSIDTDENFAPQFYPLLVNSDIRSRLVEKKIYIPLMWRKTLSEEFDGFAEKTFSEKLISLPVEPDYSETDMEYLAKTVIALLT
ncbi:MAG: ATP-grasp domain-containing protein [Ruminococcaceae bacterium]|nr:ATP-grasp domain-containing protein [Oscillospiraceae bacterium]